MSASADCASVWQDALRKAGLLPDPSTHICFVATSSGRVSAERFVQVMEENFLAAKVIGTGNGPMPEVGENCPSVVFYLPPRQARLCGLIAKLSGVSILRVDITQRLKGKTDEDPHR